MIAIRRAGARRTDIWGMGWKLDDNQRGGFHYLFLGVAVIGVPAALLALFDHWHRGAVADGTLPLGVFHNGYILFDGDRVTVADTTRGERLAYACALALAACVLVAVPLLAFRVRWAWRAGRWACVLTLGWCMASALFLPRTGAVIGPGMQEVDERAVIVGDITVPFTLKRTTIVWSGDDELFGQSLPVAGISDVFRMGYYRTHGGDTLLFATTGARADLFGPGAVRTPSDDAAARIEALLYRR